MSNHKVNEALVRKAPKSTENLLNLLFEGLDWPRPRGMEIEDVPLLDWSPDELHLDPASVARLTKIQQLPALTAKQPFGVFILSFDGGQLPVGAVRRVVNRLVRKKRAGSKAAKSLWDLNDLIFFCQSSNGVSTLHVVAFRDTDTVPVMKVISWDTAATDNRIELIASQNLPSLCWPDTGSINSESWRDQWGSAFTASYREGIKTSAALAAKMADVAKVVRDEVFALYAVESKDGPLRQLFDEVRKSLRADLTQESFADMYAQTMVYGLLTARITHPEDFETDAVNSVLKFDNPFLDAMYSSFRRKGDQAFDVDEFGLHDLAEVLARADINQILADFGSSERKDDPVVFFYEEFLERYDPAQRKELGTYYTPIPVVRFMVRAVDEIIKTEFGLPLGVADQTSWAEYSKAQGIKIPNGLKASDKVIRMIDPATGTGTYLLEWMRQAKANLLAANKYSSGAMKAVVEQMDAFEISLSSYAVAHLKTSLELDPELRASTHMGIRLTDTLAGRSPEQQSLFGDDPIALEGQIAEQVKFETHHSVVIGNPPYLRTSGISSDGDAVGGIVRFNASGGPGLIADFTKPLAALGAQKHAKNLYNLYVYFWRWAVWKLGDSVERPGVAAFITASSYLEGPGFAGMRTFLRDKFDLIYIIDLGGEGRGPRKDDNVFLGVMTPVTIAIGVKLGARTKINPDYEVRYLRVEGSRIAKLETLSNLGWKSQMWSEVKGEAHSQLKAESQGTYSTCPFLTELFPWQHAGVQFKRTWTIAPSSNVLDERWRKIVGALSAKRAALFTENHVPALDNSVTDPISGKQLPGLNTLSKSSRPVPAIRYLYRAFDRQWCLPDNRVCYSMRPPLWLADAGSQVFMVSFLTGQIGMGPAATASSLMPDLHAFRGSFGGKHIVPLYRDASGTPNVDPELLKTLEPHLGNSLTVEKLFAYCYGVLAGTDYTERFREELETPGPRVPITRDAKLFNEMVAHGEYLLWLQTFGERFRDKERKALKIDPAIKWTKKPSRIADDSKDFSYNADTEILHVADGKLAGVSPEVWSFEVSGMTVIKKWLGYRTAKGAGKAASSDSPLDKIRPTEWEPEWLDELREIVHVLTETERLRPKGVEILDRIMDGELISADELPKPPEVLRKPPSANDVGGLLDEDE